MPTIDAKAAAHLHTGIDPDLDDRYRKDTVSSLRGEQRTAPRVFLLVRTRREPTRRASWGAAKRVTTSMNATKESADVSKEVIYSPALYLKKFEATQPRNAGRGRRMLSGTRVKALAMPLFDGLFRRAPRFVSLAPVHAGVLVWRALYVWRGNPLRRACENICQIAQRRGYTHDPKNIYLQVLKNLTGTAKNYFALYRDGADKAMDNVHLSADDARNMNQLIERYGGVILAVPHNVGAVLAAAKMDRAFPLLLVSRNSSTIARTKIAVDCYERMGVTVLMVRGGNPFELSRTLFAVLKSGKVVAATVDSIEKSKNAVEAEIFGQAGSFNPWAAKIAARMGIPVVPSYYRSNGQSITVCLGEPIMTDDVTEMIRLYIRFFEENILQDPASWGFLLDKRWMRILRSSVNQTAATRSGNAVGPRVSG
jgi:lauroyl/myristoyl acyltransferase